MTRDQYLEAALRLYLEAPDTPSRTTRRDLRVAAELYRQGVPLDHLAHAIRLATLRRRGQPHAASTGAIHSLAYYRAVVQRLSADELEPDYVDYVLTAYDRLQGAERPTSEPRSRRHIPALSDSR